MHTFGTEMHVSVNHVKQRVYNTVYSWQTPKYCNQNINLYLIAYDMTRSNETLMILMKHLYQFPD